MRLLIVAALLALAVVWSLAGDEHIHPPTAVAWPSLAAYQPDRPIAMTLHEYKRGGRKWETTGRHTTFAIPQKFLAQSYILEGGVPHGIHTHMLWREGPDGEIAFETLLDERGREIKDPGRDPPKISGRLSNWRKLQPEHNSWNKYRDHIEDEMIAARRSGMSFPGYDQIAGSTVDKFYKTGEYCGYDAFESDVQWQTTQRGRLPFDVDMRLDAEPPMHLGRYFAYPAGGEFYDLIIECKPQGGLSGLCNVSVSLDSYVYTTYLFNSSRLCEIQPVIRAHLDFLRGFIAEQVAERTN